MPLHILQLIGRRRRCGVSHHPTQRARPAVPLALLACVCTLLSTALLLGGCAALAPARMALPAGLEAAEPQAIEGLHGGEHGEFRLGERHGRFERSASSLTLFERLAQDRSALRYSLQPDQVQAECQLRASTATLGVLQFPLKRAALACTLRPPGEGPTHRLELMAVDAAAGTRAERRGHFEAGDLRLELQSLHRVQGSALPMATPVGYVLAHQGRPVAALDLSDSLHPRLWQRSGEAPGSALSQAVVQAALALALMWDPATL